MTVRIVTDSSADLPADLVQQHGITVLPCYVLVDDQTFKDGVEIKPDDFYRRLQAEGRFPTTAQPTVADFQEVYRDLAGQGDQVLSIHVSGKLSGTLNSAEQAKVSLNGEEIEIVDSQLASIPLGLAVLAAATTAYEGGSLQEVAEKVRQELSLHHGLFALDTLEYLHKGGRIGKARAFMGSVLHVKPILRLQDGEAHPVERPRNRERAMRRLVELASELAPVRRLAVIHSTDPDRMATLKQGLTGLLPADQIIEARFGSTLGTYIGPDALGVAVTQEPR
ncbi:MAG: fatty acid-binding protein DegV [Chloroflexi bacterium]|nr:fatty acid-binding protein DegV [Chloroflexota bacterium]MDP6498161.1 DegV family protein [Dehalococcoidia bacterium]MQG55180.1 DegV family protein [SAR202 cluster bacterium]|tara:strand:- start:65059 stop:65898 length:840 start_codon:yes stop_codon:yes gene_type:complete